MKDQYVVLTGAKNNAGDYLIKHRVESLFKEFRSDRAIVALDSWKLLNDDCLAEINASRALILAGGPALQPHMYPGIYPLTDDLDRIKVPVIAMAIGWKSAIGTWGATHDYPLSEKTLKLLKKIEASGFLSSVRDYHTLNVLNSHGFDRFLMTGCAALYYLDPIDKKAIIENPLKRISFSLGVNFFKNKKLSRVNKDLILRVRDAFPDSKLTVVLHHSVDSESYLKTHSPNLRLLNAQLDLILWLDEESISWIDVSGSHESMVEHYFNCDLHLGYRVHAHIFMASICKPTVLIAEDGRGTALEKVLGGLIFDGCFRELPGVVGKAARRFGCTGESLMKSHWLPSDLIRQLKYEIENDYPRISGQLDSVRRHFTIMQEFIKQLP